MAEESERILRDGHCKRFTRDSSPPIGRRVLPRRPLFNPALRRLARERCRTENYLRKA